MRSCSAIAAALLACGVLVGRPSASAAGERPTPSDKNAESDAAKAGKALAARNFSGAADAYESAFRRAPNYKWLFNAASARQRNGDLTQAANEYARYLKEAPDTAPLRQTAKKELATLAAKLGQLEIKADGASLVTVDGEAIDLAITASVYVIPGTHLVEARFGEGNVKESPTARTGQLLTVVLAPPAPPPPAADPIVTPARSEKPAPQERDRPLPPLVVWIGAGATVVAGGLTLISGLDVLSQKDTFDAQRSQENLDTGKDKQLRTNILLAVTGTAAVLTGVAAIWFVDWRGRGTEASVKVGAGPGAIVIGGAF